MNLAKNFTLAELTYSARAVALGLDNTPSPAIIEELRATAAMLQRIRDHLTKVRGRDTPLKDISGYRAVLVNRAVGSSDTSDHVRGRAADFEATGMSAYEVCVALAPVMTELGIEQLINEGTWVHVGRTKQAKMINRVLTIDKHGTRAGILQVRL